MRYKLCVWISVKTICVAKIVLLFEKTKGNASFFTIYQTFGTNVVLIFHSEG